MKKQGEEVVVIAHDAGAAEVLAAYVRKHADRSRFVSYVAGPAARIWRRERLSFFRISSSPVRIRHLIRKHKDASLMLLGTGWMTHIESDALAEAKKQNIRTAVYLESWSRYRERFGYPHIGWQKKLPDEVWVGDRYAIQIVRRQFPKTLKTRLVPNEYFAKIVRKHRSRTHSKKPEKPDSILFLSSIDKVTQGAFEALMHTVAREKKNRTVCLRFHPADDRSRFDAIIKKYQQVKVRKSREQDITNDLLQSAIVVGVETTAMAVAALVGKKIISILPEDRRSTLPFPLILRARNLAALTRFLRS